MKNKNQTKVLIVIPCYNYGNYLPEAIESALGQTMKCTVAVVDDGSTDKTREVVAKYPEVIYFYKENGGLPAKARNYAIQRIESEYILPLDADDILLPEYAETASKFLDENQDIDVVTSDGNIFGSEDGFISSSVFGDWLRQYNTMVYCSMFRRTFFDKVEGYNEDLPSPGIEDWVMWVKGYMSGSKAYKLPKPMWKYRIHPDSMTFLQILPKMQMLQSWMKDKGYTL